MKNFLDEAKDLHFVILYGSQLGQAKSIAEGLENTAGQEHDLRTKTFALNDVPDISDLTKLQCPIVIVTSTTGDGDPPENADKFWRKIRRKTLKPDTLLCVRYAILGLGDTNYNNFCNCGKTIHSRLQELGATIFYPPGWADDGTGIEEVVDGWIQNLWPALKKAIGIQKLGSQSAETSVSAPLIEVESEKKKSETNGNNNINEMAAKTNSTASSPANIETKALTLPMAPTKSLILEYLDTKEGQSDYDLLKPAAPYPLIEGSPIEAVIAGAKVLTKSGALKTTLETVLEVSESFDFEPGDSVGIVCSNPAGEVEAILKHLDLLNKADDLVNIKLNPVVLKGKIPPHLPVEKTSLRDFFTYVCDIRTHPKKALLRHLGESCSNDPERVELLTFSSKQGSVEYNEKILNPAVSLLDLFLTYPSCKPDVAVLLEHLPRLQPRAYSICSSPLDSSTKFAVAFNVIEIPKESPRQYSRRGICTGALYELCKEKFRETFSSEDSEATTNLTEVETELVKSSVCHSNNKIVLYRRKNQNFRLPKDLSKPIIMIGPGTGVAPFIGFIRHRQILAQKSPNEAVGKSILYFGCRYKEKDFLYEQELNKFVEDSVLSKLYVSFSRDDNQDRIKYVQDRMLLNKEETVRTLLEDEGYFYVCGDAKNMARNVREALIKCIEDVKGLDTKDAMAAVNNLVMSKRYLADVWA